MGYFDGLTLSNCYASGNVSGTSDCGGLVGYLSGRPIYKSFSTGQVSGTSDVGGLVGKYSGVGATATNCYWNKTVNPTLTDAFGHGRTTAQMTQVGNYFADESKDGPWDFTLAGNKWAFNGTDTGGYPFLRQEVHTPVYVPADIFLVPEADMAVAGNWSEGVLPGAGSKAVIPSYLFAAVISPVDISSADLNVEAFGGIGVTNTGQFTSTGTITAHDVNGMSKEGGSFWLLNINGSVIVNSVVGGALAVNYRSMDHTAGVNHGWHLLSSPMTAQTVQPYFVPNPPSSGTQGFFYWVEPSSLWINSKDGTGGFAAGFDPTFVVGKGYLVNYPPDVTLNFIGSLNTGDYSFSNLSKTGSSGWHLMGNPFSSAITWSPAANTTNVAAIAKIWKETTASYSDITSGNVIPALQGFFIQVTSAVNSIQIPASSRVHSAQPWYKSTTDPTIRLTAKDIASNTAQESVVTFNPESTNGYDPEYDSRFLGGYAPQFFSVAGEENLSTNSLPGLTLQTTIPYSFIKTGSTDFSIVADKIENLDAQVYLTDLKLNKTQNLSQNPNYTFTSADVDVPARFLLSFSPLGIGDKNAGTSSIYCYDNTLMVCNPGFSTLQVSDMLGQTILSQITRDESLFSTKLNLAPGTYIVKLQTGSSAMTQKIIVR